MRVTAFTAIVAVASAFVPGLAPMKLASAPVAQRAALADVEMMPKVSTHAHITQAFLFTRVCACSQFLKDLFPNMDKPDDVIGNIKSMFGMGDDEPAPEEPAPEEPAPEEAPPSE